MQGREERLTASLSEQCRAACCYLHVTDLAFACRIGDGNVHQCMRVVIPQSHLYEDALSLKKILAERQFPPIKSEKLLERILNREFLIRKTILTTLHVSPEGGNPSELVNFYGKRN